MANTVYGPYVAHAWNNGDGATATRLNNIETQSSLAFHGFNPDLIGAGFFVSGCAASGTVGTTTVNIASGVAYTLMTDGTLGRITVTSTTQTTATPSTTYHLYLQPDGTYFWSTAGSGQQTNSLHIADVATNGSGQISSITDFRNLNPSLFPSLSSFVEVPVGFSFGALSSVASTPSGQGMLWVSGNNAGLASPLSGSTGGVFLAGWNGSSRVIPFSVNGQFGSAPTYITGTGAFGGIASQATAGSFGVPVIVAQAIDQNVTTTGNQTYLSFTPGSNGLYRCSATVALIGSGASTITAKVQYHDPNINNTINAFCFGNDGVSTAVLSSAAMTKGRVIQIMSNTFYADTGGAISFQYTDATTTVNDWVSVFLERIS